MEKGIFKSFDGQEISYLFFGTKRDKAKCDILIMHGMMEHKERYEEFSEFLAVNGYNAYVFDIRGHGDLIEAGEVGTFEKGEGMDTVIQDMEFFIKEKMKNPVLLFGHSLGAILTLKFMEENIGFDKFILSAPPYTGRFNLFMGNMAAGMEGIFKKKKASFLNKNFQKYNEKFQTDNPANTEYEEYNWLSRDENELKKYSEDLKCGYDVTPKFFQEIFKAMKYSYKNLDKINKKATSLIIYGTEDPVTEHGKSVEILKNHLKKEKRKIEILENKGGRHESLNEINKYEVYDCILKWLNNLFTK